MKKYGGLEICSANYYYKQVYTEKLNLIKCRRNNQLPCRPLLAKFFKAGQIAKKKGQF